MSGAWTNVNIITNTIEPEDALYNLSSIDFRWKDIYCLYLGSNAVAVDSFLEIGYGAGLIANGSYGANGSVLISNGSSVYWGSANTAIPANTGLVSNATGIHVLANNGITANETGVYVQANNGLVANTTGLFVMANNGIISNTNGVFVRANNGIVSNSTGVFVLANNGLVANTTGTYVLANNGIVSNSTGVYVLANTNITANSTGLHVLANSIIIANNGIVSNSTGVFVQANNGLVANSSGVHVLANTGIVVSSTGVSVNSAYINTISSNNATYLNSQPASYYTNATNLSTGTVPTARLASGTASATTYLRGDQTWATITSSGGTVTSIATGTGLTGGSPTPITTTGTISLATAGAGAATYSSGISSITVDAYGRVTSVTGSAGYGTGTVTSVSGTAGRISTTGTTSVTVDLATAGAGAATYSSGISSVTVDAYGRVTSVSGSANYAPLASPTFTGTVTMPGTSAFTSTGLGVGTTSPNANVKLDVRGKVYIANQVSVGTTFDYGSITIIGGTTYNTAVSYGYLTSSGTGVYSGPSQSITVSLYAGERILAAEVDAFSDRRLKKDIVNIDEDKALNFINTANGVNFNWINTENSKSRTGYIAQDLVKAGFDNLVSLSPHSNMEEVIDDDGFVSPAKHMFTVNYDQVVPYLSTALRHSLKRIEGLETLVEHLEARVTALESK